MPPGMSHRLNLQSKSETVWTTKATVWGAFVKSEVTRQEEAQQMVETLQHQIVIRYRDDVASGWRFLLGGREISILAIVDPDQSRRFLSCRCEEAAR